MFCFFEAEKGEEEVKKTIDTKGKNIKEWKREKEDLSVAFHQRVPEKCELCLIRFELLNSKGTFLTQQTQFLNRKCHHTHLIHEIPVLHKNLGLIGASKQVVAFDL